MNQNLNDEQFDRLMQTVFADATPAEDIISEIADSPATWWAVQRKIATERDAAKSPWPPAILRRWLMIGVPSLAVLTLLVGLFVFRADQISPVGQEKAVVSEPKVAMPQTDSADNSTRNDIPQVSLPIVADPIKIQPVNLKRSIARREPFIQSRKAMPKAAPKLEQEIVKSNFIALTYGGNPDSGHVVRVKVPSSMMVSLGVVQSVNKPTSLIDAEVVVGDDGQSHAIRFIR